MKPSIGRTVIMLSGGSAPMPAIITRVWGQRDTEEGAVAVNLTAFPDCAAPIFKQSVMLFETAAAARASCHGVMGAIAAHWPERV